MFEHKHNPVPSKHIIDQAVEYTYLASSSLRKIPKLIKNVNWEPPPKNHYKLNTDGATSIRIGKSGIGGVNRNHT